MCCNSHGNSCTGSQGHYHVCMMHVMSHLTHELAATVTETVALVGKGIVYDTGGLSLKSKDGMPGLSFSLPRSLSFSLSLSLFLSLSLSRSLSLSFFLSFSISFPLSFSRALFLSLSLSLSLSFAFSFSLSLRLYLSLIVLWLN